MTTIRDDPSDPAPARDVDGDHHVAVVAVVALAASNASEKQAQVLDRGVGVAPYIRSTTDPATAEVAIAVIDEHHGTGIGRVLLAAIVDLASQNGIGTLTAACPGWDSNPHGVTSEGVYVREGRSGRCSRMPGSAVELRRLVRAVRSATAEPVRVRLVP